jgi:hypothetical protein
MLVLYGTRVVKETAWLGQEGDTLERLERVAAG